ncbi:MAG: hypothetical protein A2580_10770 [Hydrogenophilales bacterium RIFOXYD1_FULL_62_11]|nr:MAG: hypothetical protein A2580_10770 [Hydrogenophilales bacterium RIFOXYD1_FULL_62_11]
MLFLIPHLFPPPRLLETAAQDLQLPALQTLLARGTRLRCPDEGAEAALCEALGIARQQDWPLAPITLAADGGAGGGYWLRADPVHLRVMRDRIVLADSSLFDLLQQEADALVASIRQHFGDALRPLPLHPTRWYLHFPHAPHLRTTPVSVASGRDIHPLLPQGDAAGPLRVRLNELQMLLFDHPVNLAREARGELPVNSVWLWGGGSAPVAPPAGRPVYARDATARALGAFCGSSVYPPPPQLEPAMLKTAGVVLLDDLTLAGQCGDAYGWREAMRELERSWFVPLLAALRTVDAAGLSLLDPVNGRGLQLQAMDAWKIWRRPRSLIVGLA